MFMISNKTFGVLSGLSFALLFALLFFAANANFFASISSGVIGTFRLNPML